jgi:NADH-quinone oxidoreductase subunit N
VALFLCGAIVTILLSYRYLAGRAGELEEYYLLISTATMGAITMAVAVHFATFLLGLEILAISLYALIAYPEDEGHPPLEASLKYLVLSGVGSATLLFGMALIYNDTGSLAFSAISESLAGSATGSVLLIVGNVMLLAGIAFKLSLVPFHMWTPDVYQGAPAPVTGYLATVSKGAVLVTLLRIMIDGDALSAPAVFAGVSLLAGLSMIIGNLLALLQTNVKRILAYSSIAHLGYVLIGLLAVHRLTGDPAFAVETVAVYLTAYVIMTLAAFGVVTVLSSPTEQLDYADVAAYEGLFWRRPALAAVLTTALLSLAGIPLTVGFIAKFYLFAAGVQGALWMLLWTLIVGSGIGLYYYLRIIFAMSKQEAHTPEDSVLSLQGEWILVVLGVLLIVFGVYPSPLIEVIQNAVVAGG